MRKYANFSDKKNPPPFGRGLRGASERLLVSHNLLHEAGRTAKDTNAVSEGEEVNGEFLVAFLSLALGVDDVAEKEVLNETEACDGVGVVGLAVGLLNHKWAVEGNLVGVTELGCNSHHHLVNAAILHRA